LTVQRFKQGLIEHSGDPVAIKGMCCDMSPACISGVQKQVLEAHLTFDKFGAVNVLNDAVAREVIDGMMHREIGNLMFHPSSTMLKRNF
jgi:transposase